MYRNTILIVLHFALIFVSPVFPRGESEEQFLIRIGLTDDQIVEIKNIYQTMLHENTEIYEDIFEYRTQIGEAFAETPPNINNINSALEQSLELEYKIYHNFIMSEIDAREILGNELWAAMIAMRDKQKRHTIDIFPLLKWDPETEKGWLFRHEEGPKRLRHR